MERDFNIWLSKFRSSIADYKYYADFDKIVKNVEKVKVELNILNSLIGSPNIGHDFEDIVTRYPETLKCIPLLLAVRKNQIRVLDQKEDLEYDFEHMNYPLEQYRVFMEETGLFDMLSKRLVSNLLDYALGVETGLDTNARKNRGGILMENLVESYIVKAGFIKGQTYFKEMQLAKIKELWGYDLNFVTADIIKNKRFDFVVKTNSHLYTIEVNFYSGSGSKLNETARSYKLLAQQAKEVNNFTFVWVTDGYGWKATRADLHETFEVLETLYNISDLENDIFAKIFV